MKIGRLLLRLTVGGFFIGHGTQKLFGWFGGYGPDGTGQFFEQLGRRPGRKHASRPGSRRAAAARCWPLGWRHRSPHQRSPPRC